MSACNSVWMENTTPHLARAVPKWQARALTFPPRRWKLAAVNRLHFQAYGKNHKSPPISKPTAAGARACGPSCKNTTCPTPRKDIIQNPAFRWEMEQRSGQPLSPCVEINDTMLADVSGDEVERFLVENNMTRFSDKPVAVPTDSACTDQQHAEMARGAVPLEFKSGF